MKRYAITVGIGLAISAVLALVFGLTKAESAGESAKIISDAFMVGGGIILAGWVIKWAGKTGTFDWITYSFGALWQWIRSLWAKNDPNRIGAESYADYSERTHEEREKKNYSHLLVVSLLLIAVSTVAAVAYMNLQ